MKDYHINIFYSEEDGGYIADIPDLPHCAAFGESPEEALAEVLRAEAVWMEDAKAEGKPVPPPSFKPVIYQLSEVPARPVAPADARCRAPVSSKVRQPL
jgi:predicted RNase H-like HicB family nuclease